MADHEILIKFDGRDADQHVVDMRLLGRSLQGFDRIISDGIILFSENRLPRHGERAHLKVKAKAPSEGSQDIIAILQDSSGLLPLAWKILTDSDGEIIWRWVSFVLEYYGGRKDSADKHLEVILELNKQHLEARDKSDERWHAQLGSWRDKMFALVDKLAVPATQAVAPVGPSVRKVGFSAGRSPQTEVDEAMADAIRSKGELEVGDLQTMRLKTDGFVYHTRKLNVEHPEEPGHYLSADVKDPIFERQPNVYTEAAIRKATIEVQAKPAYRGGRLERIYIMNFDGALDDIAA